MLEIRSGVYPTMITPYRDGAIDYEAVRRLTDWYIEKGCDGIFAVCQSSEMAFLSLEERVQLAEAVVRQANGRIPVLASGHCGNGITAQVQEIKRISATGIDGFVLVSNRFDLHHDGDDVWLDTADRVLREIDPALPLGIYECPAPYKRLLTPRILRYCLETGRFRFIKDTCCDPDMLTERLDILRGSDIKLFNANAQTLLHSLQHGAAGYSGILANFCPELLCWLYRHFDSDSAAAQRLSDIISMTAFTESPAYPCTAKYYLSQCGVPMTLETRSGDPKRFTPYQKMVMNQLLRIDRRLAKELEV